MFLEVGAGGRGCLGSEAYEFIAFSRYAQKGLQHIVFSVRKRILCGSWAHADRKLLLSALLQPCEVPGADGDIRQPSSFKPQALSLCEESPRLWRDPNPRKQL